MSLLRMFYIQRILHEFFGPRPLVLKEIDGLLVPPGKAYTMLTGYLITG